MILVDDRRTSPLLPIEPIGRRLGRLVSDPGTRLAAEPVRDGQLAVLAGLDGFDHIGPALAGSLLRPVLDHHAVLLGSRQRHASFVDVVAGRFFHVTVLTRLSRPDHRQRVPVVGTGDRNSVQVLVVQRFADLGRAVRGVADAAAGVVDAVAVGIDHPGDVDVFHLVEAVKMASSSASDTDNRDVQSFVGAQDSGAGLGARDMERSGGPCGAQGALEELAAMQSRHGSILSSEKVRISQKSRW